jgi:hypothetical protein
MGCGKERRERVLDRRASSLFSERLGFGRATRDER